MTTAPCTLRTSFTSAIRRALGLSFICAVVGIISVISPTTSHAQSATRSQGEITAEWEIHLRDSLAVSRASATERSLQFLLDSLGYSINVATDETGQEVFCGRPGNNKVKMLLEVAGSAVYATSGYYKAHDTSIFYQFFGPTSQPGDSVTFNIGSTDSIGFYMKPNLPGNLYTWLSENSLNSDAFNHMKVFPTGVPHQYVLAFEDLPNGGDQDWNDLVFRVDFLNEAPILTLPPDSTVFSCTNNQICFDLSALDPNCQGDSLYLAKLSGPGSFTLKKGKSSITTSHCFTPTGPGTYTFVFRTYDQLGLADTGTYVVTVVGGNAPVVMLPADTTLAICAARTFCVPVSITDANCDITSVTSIPTGISGSVSSFDQIAKIISLGGTVTQIGGGNNGGILAMSSNYVAPVNTTSGLTVTLPNFLFAQTNVSGGSFSTAPGPATSAFYVLGAPTDLTFTTPGVGGPDGGDGDGSLDMTSNQTTTVGWTTNLTTCNGSNSDFVLFTNTGGGGTVELRFRLNGSTVHTVTTTLPGAASGTGTGGVVYDLPDGITYNEVRIKCVSGTIEVDALARRTVASTNELCFTVDTAGVYKVIVTATDACSNVDADTMLVTVTTNQPPVANAGADFTRFQCTLAQICFPVSITDPNGNLTSSTLVQGPGTLSGGQICYTPSSAGSTTFIIQGTDACGATDRDTVVVTVTLNSKPVAVDGTPISITQCTPAQICRTFTASDVNGGTLSWSLLTGSGTINAMSGQYCFTPTGSGAYGATVIVTDSCGGKDTTSFTWNVTVNGAPVAVNPTTPVALFICDSQTICHTFTASDPNSNPLSWMKLSGAGTVTPNGQWCFAATTTGSYTVTAKVSDSCGAADTVSLTYNITRNAAPVIAFGADTTINLCSSQQVCVAYTVSDPNSLNASLEALVSGSGTINTAANTVCFTPVASGVSTFVVSVTDSCGLVDLDTINVTVNLNQAADIVCPSGPIAANLCAPGQVCQTLAITPPSAVVTTSLGTYSGGQLCFNATTTGTYNAQVIATTPCGADTCNIVFNVTVGQPPSITCPPNQTAFVCGPQNVCIPVGVMGSGVTVTATPAGSTYASGQLCVPVDTAGVYAVRLIASGTCGADTCTFNLTVTRNASPVATNPPASVDTFICAPANVCRQFAATDVNGGALTWSILSGTGTVSPAGLWCFSASATGAYTVSAQVTDSCGAADTVSMTYNVTINAAPSIALGADSTFFQCTAAQICLPYVATDANSNVQAITLVSGSATIDQPNSRICFTPGAEGTYTFILSITDSCGATDRDTIVATVDFNVAPVASAGADQTIFQCAAAQICLPVSATDADNNLTSLVLVTGPGTLSGNQICFTPSGTLNYEFVIKATDACGLTDFDTVVVFYTLNAPPVADAGRDSTLFKCNVGPICWNAGATDPNGNLTSVSLISGPGSFSSGQICFTPTVSGTYTFILQATDACGATDRDTAVIYFTLNSAPVCIKPKDTTVFQCTPAKFCLPAGASDIDGNLATIQITSGPGSIANNEWCYTPSGSQTVNVTFVSTDSCGAFCSESFSVTFIVNDAPTIALGADIDTLLCTSSQICLPYTVSDLNDPRPRTVSLISGTGTLNTTAQTICFTPGASGTYTFIIDVTDECLASDRDTITVTVELNDSPVVNAGPDQTLFQCSNSQVCWPVSASDPDGNLQEVLFNGPGVYNGSTICFTPGGSGAYLFTLRATDSCGATVIDTVIITINLNSAPVVALGNDTTVFQCTPAQICLPYTVSDANGMARLTEVLVSGSGSIDTVLNRVCFTPGATGSYTIIVSVTDSCGATDADTIVVNVTLGDFPVIDCPSGPIAASLCGPGQVCYALGITPVSAVVTTNLGTYSGGQLCFTANTTGTYNARVIATTSCGVDTCDIVFNVTVGESATVSCPGTVNLFACATGEQLCVPVTVMGAGATVTVSGGATYSAGTVCFNATTSGSFNFTVIAATSCGADTCSFTANVTVNSKPVAVDPATPVDTFLCVPAQICRQFTASDVNGGSLTWTRLSGAGTVSASGLWCFTPVTAGSYSVVAVVSDSCGGADTVTMAYNVTLNVRPTMTLPANFSVAQCTPTQICVNYTVADPNNNVVSETVTGSPAVTLDTVLNRFCFTPSGMGTFTFVATATDACGLSHADTISVTVDVNDPPVVNAGSDLAQFQCTPTQICRTITTSDPDNNFATLTLLSGPGTLSGNQYCFTPVGSGLVTAIFQGTDSCGATDLDTVIFTITLNSAPSCNLPNDTTYFQCTPTMITRPVNATDVNGNFSRCEILSGPGSLSGGIWSFTPTVDQSFFVKIQCLDSCGATCIDSFRVTIDLNTAPVANAGRDTTFFLCGDANVCWTASCSDIDNNLANCEILSPPGVTYSSGQICLPGVYGDGTDKTYSVVLKSTDACGATDFDTVVVTLNFNTPPVINAPPSFTAFLDQAGELCFDVNVTDGDNNIATVTTSFGTYSSSTGQVCIMVDSSGTYCMTVTATDACGASVTRQICITVQIDECIHVQIEKTHNSFQGQHVPVNIYLNGSGKPIGGFDFLISYDNSALSLTSVSFGSLPVGCDWEYFTYRFGPFGNCGSGCPSGQVRIVGLAETNNGAYHPSCFLDGQIGTLATLDFLVSNNRTFECQYAPVRFYWIDCGDNGLSSPGGDTLWVSRDVFDFEGGLITSNNGTFPQYGGMVNTCLNTPGLVKGRPIRCVDFTNGGVDIVCADSIDARGDINLNGFFYEISDAVMFTTYFIKGLAAFGTHVEGSIAASDANADGLPLTVADLVYLIRVITGDASGFDKLVPDAKLTSDFAVVNDYLTISKANDEIGAFYLVLAGKVDPVLSEQAAAQMELRYEFDGTDTRVLIHNSKGKGALTEGEVVHLGSAPIRSIEVSTKDGQMMTARINTVPTDYALDQNYPNPFNPITTISFALPNAAEVTLEIFNVLGQTVESRTEKMDAGYHKLEWDGSAYASGVYFYRLQADRFVETKKMVMIK